MRRGARGAGVVLGACLWVATTGVAEEGEPANLIVNGGFEEWGQLDPDVAASEPVRNVTIVPPSQAPTGWVPWRENARDHPEHTGTVALDEQVKHSGDRSVRIENGDMRDITLVQYSTERFAADPDDPHNIRPSRRYLVRWWVRGQEVNPAGTGPILMMYCRSERDGKPYRTDSYEQGVALPNGTFDWQQRQFTFITDEHARWANFTLQLRWTTGTIWYDDVELVDLGPVVQVETY